MSAGYDASRLDELLSRLLDETALPQDLTAEINAILLGSPAARAHYRSCLRVHAALVRTRRLADSPEIVAIPAARRRWKPAGWAAAVAACIALSGFFMTRSGSREIASMTGSTAAVWAGNSDHFSLRQPVELVRGFAEITYRNGVRVILEGPCRFQVSTENSMEVTHGRATVRVPHSQRGFRLNTPAGGITDLGTEFGVAVGSGVEGPVTLTQVFDGMIEIPADNKPDKRLMAGDSLAIVRESGATRLVPKLGDYRVDLGGSARKLPVLSGTTVVSGNLALGKPATTPDFYQKSHGSVFPASALTDGRLNDSGSPGDWSFWLAANGNHGEFTVDLLENSLIGRLEFQNTRNRIHDDRGLKEISVQVSQNGRDFHEVLHTELRRISELPPAGVDFPIESFEIPPTTARYVKVVGLDHYRNAQRLPEDPNHGGGLNEIRIFAP